jgi:hypothetical protein
MKPQFAEPNRLRLRAVLGIEWTLSSPSCFQANLGRAKSELHKVTSITLSEKKNQK